MKIYTYALDFGSCDRFVKFTANNIKDAALQLRLSLSDTDKNNLQSVELVNTEELADTKASSV
jgi:hypothetical protein